MWALIAVAACCGLPLVGVLYVRWIAQRHQRARGQAAERPRWSREIDRLG